MFSGGNCFLTHRQILLLMTVNLSKMCVLAVLALHVQPCWSERTYVRGFFYFLHFCSWWCVAVTRGTLDPNFFSFPYTIKMVDYTVIEYFPLFWPDRSWNSFLWAAECRSRRERDKDAKTSLSRSGITWLDKPRQCAPSSSVSSHHLLSEVRGKKSCSDYQLLQCGGQLLP